MKSSVNKLNSNLYLENYFSFTMDTDWASEYAIEETIQFFIENGIKLTVFSTNPSDVVNKYLKKSEINIGIHPNFIEGSSQGNSNKEVIDYCTENLPATNIFRCHRWYSDNDVYDLLWNKGFRFESNVCTMFEVLPVFIQRCGMVSFPVFFEDGAFIQYGGNLDFNLSVHFFKQPGLKVIDIHPMHFMLNTPYFKYTREIKDRVSREEWNSMDQKTISALRYKGCGIADYTKSLINFVTSGNTKIITLEQLYSEL